MLAGRLPAQNPVAWSVPDRDRETMLTPPHGFAEEELVSTLARSWNLVAASVTYRPVGFGSHHWQIGDIDETRWFVTVDELATKRHSIDDPLDTAFDRLRAALAAAMGLRDAGRTFVVAPVPTCDGEPVARLAEGLAVAVYPFIEGQSFAWGDFPTSAHRRAVLDHLVAVHRAPSTVSRVAPVDNFAIPHRDELEATCDPAGDVDECGPYARPAAVLLAENAEPVRRLLARYDALVNAARAQRSRAVLTHGEPHPGNTMRTSDGWLLIDWDTALVAPPERDLWSLDPGDGSILDAYAAATGVSPAQSMLDLYRLCWDLADMAVVVSGFRRKHLGSADDRSSWKILRSLIGRIGA